MYLESRAMSSILAYMALRRALFLSGGGAYAILMLWLLADLFRVSI
jgi:hypothetical protein